MTLEPLYAGFRVESEPKNYIGREGGELPKSPKCESGAYTAPLDDCNRMD